MSQEARLEVEGTGVAEFKDTSHNIGIAIMDHLPALNALCDQLDLPRLESFFFYACEELDEQIEEEFDVIEDEDPGEYGRLYFSMGEWHDSSDGLRCVSALAEHLPSHPESIGVESVESVRQDLLAYEAALRSAVRSEKRFRFTYL